jgi:hypothetical protein
VPLVVEQDRVEAAGDTMCTILLRFPFQSGQLLGLPGRQMKKSRAHAQNIAWRCLVVPLFMRGRIAKQIEIIESGMELSPNK